MNDQPISVALDNLSRELDQLAGLAGNIDSAIGCVPIGPDVNGETLVALQKVDLLRQSLECLTIYVGKLACQLDETVLVNTGIAAEALPLRDLARHLIGDDISEAHVVHADNHDTLFF